MLMHEAMVAQSLLTAISNEAKKYDAKPIAVTISCGTLYAINDEALSFAFEVLAKGTTCENIKLEIKHKPLQGRCRKCDSTFEFEITDPICTNCRSDDFELLPDAPLTLEEIEFESE
jgi:hydrogenase nickel incorporation protein HypA/HybF